MKDLSIWIIYHDDKLVMGFGLEENETFIDVIEILNEKYGADNVYSRYQLEETVQIRQGGLSATGNLFSGREDYLCLSCEPHELSMYTDL